MDQAAASLETIQVLALFSQRCIMHVHCVQSNLQNWYNWIADCTIIMLVHKNMLILKISRELLANQNADSEYNV